jgi:hypothetical protein
LFPAPFVLFSFAVFSYHLHRFSDLRAAGGEAVGAALCSLTRLRELDLMCVRSCEPHPPFPSASSSRATSHFLLSLALLAALCLSTTKRVQSRETPSPVRHRALLHLFGVQTFTQSPSLMLPLLTHSIPLTPGQISSRFLLSPSAVILSDSDSYRRATLLGDWYGALARGIACGVMCGVGMAGDAPLGPRARPPSPRVCGTPLGWRCWT